MIRKASAFLIAISVWLAAGPALAQFAEQASWAGTGTGSGAAQAITLGNVLTLADILGVNVKWIPSNSNPAGGGATLNVNALGAQPIQRVTPAGMVALGGGEIIAGHTAIAMWNGTVFELQNSAAPEPPGRVMDYAGASCPTGWAAASGSSTTSQTAQAPLFGVLGTIWGSSAGGNFTLPDLRGRATFGQDSGGSNRITSAGGNFDGTVIGNTGGQQNQTLTIAQLPANPPFNPAVTITNQTEILLTDGTPTAPNSGGSVNRVTGTGVTATVTGNLGQGNAHPVLSNAAIVNKCVRF